MVNCMDPKYKLDLVVSRSKVEIDKLEVSLEVRAIMEMSGLLNFLVKFEGH